MISKKLTFPIPDQDGVMWRGEFRNGEFPHSRKGRHVGRAGVVVDYGGKMYEHRGNM